MCPNLLDHVTIKVTDNLIDLLLIRTKSLDVLSAILQEKIGENYSSTIDKMIRKIINDPELGRQDALLNRVYEHINSCYAYGYQKEEKKKLLEDIKAQQNKLKTSSFRDRCQSETGQPSTDDASSSPNRPT